MNRPHSLLVANLLIFAVIAGGPVSAGETTTVIVVRHAEKLTDSSDPELSEAGKERTTALTRMLADVELSAIYSTPFKRTIATVEPIATERGLEIALTPVDDGLEKHAEDVARRAVTDHAGTAVLVVGHSNTVPAILKSLGVDGAPPLTEKDYDDLFVVSIDESGGARLVHLHYGAVSP